MADQHIVTFPRYLEGLGEKNSFHPDQQPDALLYHLKLPLGSCVTVRVPRTAGHHVEMLSEPFVLPLNSLDQHVYMQKVLDFNRDCLDKQYLGLVPSSQPGHLVLRWLPTLNAAHWTYWSEGVHIFDMFQTTIRTELNTILGRAWSITRH